MAVTGDGNQKENSCRVPGDVPCRRYRSRRPLGQDQQGEEVKNSEQGGNRREKAERKRCMRKWCMRKKGRRQSATRAAREYSVFFLEEDGRRKYRKKSEGRPRARIGAAAAAAAAGNRSTFAREGTQAGEAEFSTAGGGSGGAKARTSALSSGGQGHLGGDTIWRTDGSELGQGQETRGSDGTRGAFRGDPRKRRYVQSGVWLRFRLLLLCHRSRPRKGPEKESYVRV